MYEEQYGEYAYACPCVTLLCVIAKDEDWTVFNFLAVCIVCDFTIRHR